jgi:hypothetical protein
MAKQAGYIKLEGTIGDLSFYKNRDGKYIARRKGGVAKDRLLNDPRFERTRENMREFSRAATAAKFLKNAFREIEVKSNGGKLHNRLYSLAHRVLKTDPVSERGERQFELGDLSLLIGFEFSEVAVMERILKKQLLVVDTTDSVSVTIPEMIASKYLVHPRGSSHYRFSLIRAGVNFVQGTYQTEMATLETLPIRKLADPEVTLSLPKPAVEGEHHFFALALEFLTQVNGNRYDLNDVSQNPAVILSAG